MAKKVVSNKTKYEELFAKGREFNLVEWQVKNLIKAHFGSFDIKDVNKYIYFLNSRETLSAHKLEDIVAWRNTVREKLIMSNKKKDIVMSQLETTIDSLTKMLQNIERGYSKDLVWYKKLGSVIAGKLKGIQYIDDDLIQPRKGMTVTINKFLL